ncbi:MAG TPA: invasion associated locus B family protein [Rhizomicrobium sp.]|nr:invasion associated locus B family protein [Rhizomicrobium sp.]
MRNTIVGLALALLFLAGLFALPQFFPHQELQLNPAQVAAKIEPGFKGARRIGPWILACGPARAKSVPLPFSFAPGKRAAPAMNDMSALGRCRTFMAFRPKANPKRIILLLNFRLLGHNQRLAALVRIPPRAKKGDLVSFRLGQKVLNLPVSACDKQSCLAAGSLTPNQEAMLFAQRGTELLLPPGPNGKRLAVRVPLVGLRAATGAMRRAEAGE